MITFISLFLVWFSLSYYLCLSYTKEISSNITNASHAIAYIFIYNLNSSNFNLLSEITASFYIYDIIYLLYGQFTSKKWNKIPYLVHHCVALYASYLMCINHLATETSYIYYTLEMSNILLYLSYHIHKTMPYHKNLILIVDFLQFLWYSYFRNIKLYSYIICQINVLLSISYTTLISIFMISSMGTYWSYLLFGKLIYQLKIVEKPKEKEC